MPPDGRKNGSARGRSAAIVLTLLLPLLVTGRTAAEEKPFGLTERPVWKGTRLVGSPEPPLPYTVEPTFAKIPWKTPLYLADEPGTDRLWVIQQGGEANRPSTIVRVKNDPAATETETVLSVSGRLVYSVAFHPRYADNGYVFVFSNGPAGPPEHTDRIDRISRYTVQRAEGGLRPGK